ncbi:aspartate-semialdehyde dehydrogenase [Buchnera aphidicola (Thelaxes californica)]|uniref:Aspartate-semialdehyde dehydrogenase n=1 Tax=Buchnera aphidicola (Thelaxes californica) TaxID=1315998 RepID=A0A4D6YAK5_9GAMM|nr:aspartate-semialdehyde dehydrogenase [Buchnera aphidicola]QCI26867.1 aspartate-semialdehyde dehydrogenase [Buchnera aphidicola (Thelaxes californica)]
MKKNVGFIGWRGMVGSVLIDRMLEEKDFQNINSVFFSTSQFEEYHYILNNQQKERLRNAYDIEQLKEMDIIISCQGSDYTEKMYFKIRNIGWQGYWIDAASSLRMNTDTLIVLDPINKQNIIQAIDKGIKTFVGGNCTVSLMLLALGGLFQNNLIDWLNVSTYQAASGAGSAYMLEMIQQMNFICQSIQKDLFTKTPSILDIEKKITRIFNEKNFPKKNFGVALTGSLIPWIDAPLNNQQTREEWKIEAETNKILNSKKNINIDGICVRVATLRCHSQSFTIKLKKDISIRNIEELLLENNQWVTIIPNEEQLTKVKLSPVNVSGTLSIPVGRLRKLNLGKKYLSIFSVGDQLLWGAAEPLRRMLLLLI